MNLKYYMRGLGTGILLTAIVFLVFDKPKELTDAEIKLKAATLGMVEEDSLLVEADKMAEEELTEDKSSKEKEDTPNLEEDLVNVDKEEVEVEQAEASDNQQLNKNQAEELEKQESDNEDSEVQKNDNLEENVISTDTNMPENVQQEPVVENYEDPELSEEKSDSTKEEILEEKEYISLIVESGDVARTVSNKLYEAGLIESVQEYNNFLSGNNYSYRIRAGEYKIPIGADHQEIANILCKLP